MFYQFSCIIPVATVIPDDISGSVKKRGTHWKVDVINNEGTLVEKRLKVNEVWELEIGEKVIIESNNIDQPVGDSGGLLSGFLGELGANFSEFPISYRSWKHMPRRYKEDIYNSVIKVSAILHQVAMIWTADKMTVSIDINDILQACGFGIMSRIFR